jgi:hypothetical protein
MDKESKKESVALLESGTPGKVKDTDRLRVASWANNT